MVASNRSRDPSGGKDAVLIMQTVDIAKSDLDLAGLMLRCGDAGTEVLVVLLRPLPPLAHRSSNRGSVFAAVRCGRDWHF